ncbi:uracil-DNA glycosylase family protein [Marinomonas sp.]
MTQELLKKVQQCSLCEAELPLGARPVIQHHPQARILIAGQAPGLKVHESGKPFDDASGERLRAWLGVSRETFYDATKFAILPMGFCYPGRGASGDLPPRSECTPAWREALLAELTNIQLTLVLGKYALAYHLPDAKPNNLTQTVQAWQDYWPSHVPLPHPSPRNNIWLKRNPWFEQHLVPVLSRRIASLLAND